MRVFLGGIFLGPLSQLPCINVCCLSRLINNQTLFCLITFSLPPPLMKYLTHVISSFITTYPTRCRRGHSLHQLTLGERRSTSWTQVGSLLTFRDKQIHTLPVKPTFLQSHDSTTNKKKWVIEHQNHAYMGDEDPCGPVNNSTHNPFIKL